MKVLDTLSAERICGRLPGGNSTSTTGPMTWMILPKRASMVDSFMRAFERGD
jgi:hypothetical protein